MLILVFFFVKLGGRISKIALFQKLGALCAVCRANFMWISFLQKRNGHLWMLAAKLVMYREITRKSELIGYPTTRNKVETHVKKVFIYFFFIFFVKNICHRIFKVFRGEFWKIISNIYMPLKLGKNERWNLTWIFKVLTHPSLIS